MFRKALEYVKISKKISKNADVIYKRGIENCGISRDLTFNQLIVCKSRGDFGLFWIQALQSGEGISTSLGRFFWQFPYY
jgi:hypothetical protein